MLMHPIRLTAGAGLLCAALAACDSGTDSAAAPAGSSSAAPSVTTSAGAPPTGIPGAALLQPADVSGAEPVPLEKGELSHVRPLRPCGDDPYPSDDTRTAAVAVRYVMEPTADGKAPTVIAEFVGRHTPGDAAGQFDEVQAALERCPGGLGEGERQWKVLGTGLAGDESVLVRIDQKVSYADEKPETVSHYAALARVNDAIVVVTDLGWEDIGGSEEMVRGLIGKAAERAGTIG
ncbi:hypothetical protein AB0F81_43315 [Actinoplanes sp. NPDC024001]|uniref:hypothetical protein n=1 Tax=Actinoplanes sp. NPDC024001 TaxID=3154598 RepID=UPI0033DDDB80